MNISNFDNEKQRIQIYFKGSAEQIRKVQKLLESQKLKFLSPPDISVSEKSLKATVEVLKSYSIDHIRNSLRPFAVQIGHRNASSKKINNIKENYNQRCYSSVKKLIENYGADEAAIMILKTREHLIPYYEATKHFYNHCLEIQMKSDNVIFNKFHLRSLYPWQEALMQMLSKLPDDRKIIYIYDKDGSAGKTCFMIHYYLAHSKNTLCFSNERSRNVLRMVAKNPPRVIFFDIRRSMTVDYALVETLKDSCFPSPFMCECTASPSYYVYGKCHVVILSNKLPDTFAMLSADRWLIGDIAGKNVTWLSSLDTEELVKVSN